MCVSAPVLSQHNMIRINYGVASPAIVSTQTNLEVVTDRVQTPARADPRAWTIVHRKAAVVIAPMTRDGKILLIRQERIPIRQAIWEIPSGQIDDRNADQENIKDVALRELR